MGNVTAELRRVQDAYATPTLGLLHADTAPVVAAILRSCFDDTTVAVDAVWLEQAADNHLATLRGNGAEKVPTGSGRELCRRWMAKQWLIRAQDGEREVYSLTSYAQSALGLIRDVGSERTGLSEHRIATVMSTARRFNAGTNPDVGERVRILEQEIERLQREKDRLTDGDSLPEVTDDYLREGYAELYDQVVSLPRDFARVKESMVRVRIEMMNEFRNEEAVPGKLVGQYVDKVNGLMTATPEGRAFEGALALLRNDDHKEQLRTDLRDLGKYPRARNILNGSELAFLRSTMDVINDGVEAVLNERQRVATSLRDYLNSHDAIEERELERVLRELDGAFSDWLERTGPRTTSCLKLPQRPDLQSLSLRFWEGAGQAEPDLLEPVIEREPDRTLEQLTAGGGPSTDELRVVLRSAQSMSGHVADVFNALPSSLRRPVELIGLLHLGVNEVDLDVCTDLDVYHTIRTDGSTRDLIGPRIVISPEEPA